MPAPSWQHTQPALVFVVLLASPLAVLLPPVLCISVSVLASILHRGCLADPYVLLPFCFFVCAFGTSCGSVQHDCVR